MPSHKSESVILQPARDILRFLQHVPEWQDGTLLFLFVLVLEFLLSPESKRFQKMGLARCATPF